MPTGEIRKRRFLNDFEEVALPNSEFLGFRVAADGRFAAGLAFTLENWECVQNAGRVGAGDVVKVGTGRRPTRTID
jgi:hypothetical protein